MSEARTLHLLTFEWCLWA